MKQYRLLSYTNKLITVNYQQFLHYFERKVIIYRKLMVQLDTRCSVSSHHGIPLSIVQEMSQLPSPSRHETKCWTIVTVRQFR